MTYSDILSELYRRHYEQTTTTEVRSSHWRKFGALTRVTRHDGQYSLSGKGFGSFIASHSIESFKQFVPNVRSRALLETFHVDSDLRSAGFRVARDSKRVVSFDCVKQILAVDLLRRHDVLATAGTIAVIGDGYGYMTALLGTILPKARIICVNLGDILFFDVYYVQRVFPNERCVLNPMSDTGQRFVFLTAEHYQALSSLPVDVFVNIASMQEMDLSVIQGYFTVMRAGDGAGYFYCCNRVDKTLPDGSSIRFDAYPWDRNDGVLVDELCPWYQRRPVLKPPYWRPFGGPIRHRLARLAKLRDCAAVES